MFEKHRKQGAGLNRRPPSQLALMFAPLSQEGFSQMLVSEALEPCIPCQAMQLNYNYSDLLSLVDPL
jgi:hypothetical protein